MPVLSPHRSSSSGLTGSYRSTFSTSSLERPFYGTNTYSPRFNSYSERYTTRSYADSNGRRIFSRSGSITEDGITTRFREESRDSSCSRRDSFSRDSGISSIRESSVLDTRRDSSLTRSDSGRNSSSDVSRLSVVDSVADLRNKYSPSNYVPAVLRNKDISRSKTLNDIGLPPLESKLTTKKKVTEQNLNTTAARSELPNNTNNCPETDNMHQEDDNGNRPSVSEMRKKFDAKERRSTSKSPLVVEGSGLRISENRFKKLDGGSEVQIRTKKRESTERVVVNGVGKTRIETKKPAKIEKKDTDVPEKRKSKILEESKTSESSNNQLASDKDVQQRSVAITNHVNNFASYIPSKDIEKEETSVEHNGDLEVASTAKIKKSKDITTSPRLNRSPVPQHNSSSGSNAASGSCISQRSSLERETGKDEDLPTTRRAYERSSPARQMGLNGLKNIGNTCFMNSVIQCLSNTKPLLEYVKKDGYVNDINTTISSMKGALIKAFAQVIKELWSEDSSDRVVNTTSLKSQIQRFAPRFMGYSQQDAQEFLRYLLEGLHEDVNRVSAKPTPIHTEIDEKLSDSEKASESWQRYVRRENSKVVDLFVGQLKSTLKCTHCGHCSVTFDPFWDLSLPIPQKTGPMRLSQCLESFTREETLDGDEKPTCSKCKERRKCTKHFTIHKFPKILVIHLKRFSPTERFRGKLSVTVDFPLEGLDMSNYAAEAHTQCRYNLYAISNHSGTTYSGHYTAYCRHPYSQSWHEYNDSRVSSISAKSIVSGEAYVLFYELDSKMAHL